MLRVLWLAGGIRRCKPDFADSNLAKLCQSDGRSTAGAHSFTLVKIFSTTEAPLFCVTTERTPVTVRKIAARAIVGFFKGS